MGFNTTELYNLDLSFKVCSAVSLISAIFIIIVYIGYKHLRSVFFLLVICMQIGDSFKSASYFLSDESVSCKVQGFLNNFGAVSSIIWSSIIANSIHHAYISNDDQEFIFKNIYLLIGFGGSIAISSLPFITGSYGDVGGYCWIHGELDLLWAPLCLYALVLVSIIYNFWTYEVVIKEIRSQTAVLQEQSVTNDNIKKVSMKFRTYPAILVICYVPSFLKFIFYIFFSENFVASLICGCLESLIGILNTLVYACTPVVMAAVKNTLMCGRKSVSQLEKFTLLLQDESNLYKDSTDLRDLSRY